MGAGAPVRLLCLMRRGRRVPVGGCLIGNGSIFWMLCLASTLRSGHGRDAMTTELTVIVPDVPGSLARLGQALGEARVNLEAIQALTRGGEGIVRFIPNRADRAKGALETAGYAYTTRQVVVVSVLDEPGALGQVALVMATAGINIDAVYVTTKGHVVLGVDDLDGAVQVAAGMAVMVGE